jgi:class 3 adenylate cyclase
LAVDEDNRVLVWAGDTETAQEVTAQSAQLTPQPATQPEPLPQVESRHTAPPSPDAERRQLTVMFCDLVDSTKLSFQLDPEDYYEVVRAYQVTCTEVIRRYEGHVAQYLGDGLLVYFGYPMAHEDDAHHAGRAGLGIIGAMEALNTHLEYRIRASDCQYGSVYTWTSRGWGDGESRATGTVSAGGSAQSCGPHAGKCCAQYACD